MARQPKKNMNIASFLEDNVRDPLKSAGNKINQINRPRPKPKPKPKPITKSGTTRAGKRLDEFTSTLHPKAMRSTAAMTEKGMNARGGKYRARAQDIRAGRATAYNSVATPKPPKPYKAAKIKSSGLGPNG